MLRTSTVRDAWGSRGQDAIDGPFDVADCRVHGRFIDRNLDALAIFEEMDSSRARVLTVNLRGAERIQLYLKY